MIKKCFILFVLFYSLIFSQEKDLKNLFDQKELKAHLEFLASDEMDGRIAPSKNLDLAARYIAVQFEKYGLKPVGDSGSYFQNFILYCKQYTEHSLSFNGKTYFKTTDILPPFTDNIEISSKTVTAPVVFVGFGITDSILKYDDYSGIDIKDKIVMFLRGTPDEKNKEGIFSGKEYSKWRIVKTKIDNAKKHGAVGAIVISAPKLGDIDIMENAYLFSPYHHASLKNIKEGGYLSDIPIAIIHERVAKELLSISGKKLEEIKETIDKSLKPYSFEISGQPAELKFNNLISPQNTKNVVGLLEGSDPVLKNEIIVLGAHYDHVGEVDGKVFNGSDDDASGTVGVIELAKAITKSERNPKRSILFIAFSAEEQGLLGSTYYVSHPIFPLDKTDVMFQFDMISRNEDTKDQSNLASRMMAIKEPKVTAEQSKNTLYVFGLSFSKDLKDIITGSNSKIKLDLKLGYDTTILFGGSDHMPFHNKKIPVGFFITGLHPDLHMPTDDVDKANFPKMERILQLAYKSVWQIADMNQKLKLNKK